LGDDVVKVMLFNTQMVVFSNFHCVHPLFVSEQVSCTVGIVWNEQPTSDKASEFLSIGGTWGPNVKGYIFVRVCQTGSLCCFNLL